MELCLRRWRRNYFECSYSVRHHVRNINTPLSCGVRRTAASAGSAARPAGGKWGLIRVIYWQRPLEGFPGRVFPPTPRREEAARRHGGREVRGKTHRIRWLQNELVFRSMCYENYYERAFSTVGDRQTDAPTHAHYMPSPGLINDPAPLCINNNCPSVAKTTWKAESIEMHTKMCSIIYRNLKL